MKNALISMDMPVTLVGGGALTEVALHAALARTSHVIAADGGANAALKASIVPDAVIGDLDSISDESRAQISVENIHQVTCQDTTDFDKAVAGISAPLILAVGFLGGRLDHELAVLSGLLKHPERLVVLLGDEDLIFLAPPKIALDVPKGTRVSLYPMAAVSGVSTGLKWPIKGLAFNPAGRVGTSNQATGLVQMRFDAPHMLIILPKNMLDNVLSSIQVGVARWPAL